MPSQDRGLPSGKNPSSALPLWNRLHRYRCLVMKYWWILALTLSLAICLAAAYEMSRPVTYESSATLTVDVENKAVTMEGSEGSRPFGGQSLDDFVSSQVLLMREPGVSQLATEKLQAKYPGELSTPVALDILPRANLLTVTANGTNPKHTQHYLEARIAGYLAYRKNTRSQGTDDKLRNIREQLVNMEATLKSDDDAIIDYQRQVGMVFSRDASAAGAPLIALKQKLAQQHDEFEQLKAMTPEQSFEHSSAPRATSVAGSDNGNSAQEQSGLESSSAEAEYRQTQADLVRLKSQLDDFSRDMRPKHPKIIALNRSIQADQNVITSLLEQNRSRIQNRLQLVASYIQGTEAEIKAEEPKALNYSLLRAKYDSLQEQKDRDLKTYTNLQATFATVNVGGGIESDYIQFRGKPSEPEPVESGWLKAMAVAVLGGLATGIGILLLIDRMDDRMGSINDFQQHFAEHVIGQIPRDHVTGNTELLRSDDDRHVLVESFRNLRSTLLFMPLDGQRPKTLLITSAVPNEGKSTVSSNLALVLAFAGMKTLLIDADLRRGAIHTAFGVTRDPGLTDVLRHGVSVEDAIRPTNVENLFVLPRGRNVPQPSEYLLDRATDRLITKLYPEYDYIIIDSSPILAADDTASLAPKIDATLFVVRLSYTSAKLTRKSLETLYNRQANIPGLILNQVDTSSPEFVYYQYSEYYHTATDDDEPAGSSSKSKAVAKVG